ncbi:MAG: Rrf2 family transcriptional regulator [Treponema sp.]|nr:Rrf2 family transcriptional regulator [Treponema sp.]
MRITTKGRYALRATLALAQMGKDDENISINELSEAEDISSMFLEQIFFKLRKAGIVQSVRGPGGGFSFARPIDSITVREIFDAAGEEMTVLPCDRSINECERQSECISHQVFDSVAGMVSTYLESLTLKTVLENEEFNPPAGINA